VNVLPVPGTLGSGLRHQQRREDRG